MSFLHKHKHAHNVNLCKPTILTLLLLFNFDCAGLQCISTKEILCWPTETQHDFFCRMPFGTGDHFDVLRKCSINKFFGFVQIHCHRSIILAKIYCNSIVNTLFNPKIQRRNERLRSGQRFNEKKLRLQFEAQKQPIFFRFCFYIGCFRINLETNR